VIPSTVFVSYSHRDELWKDRILTHLASLTEEISIAVWDDTRIPLGSEWAARLGAELAKADVAILLLSADFLSSDFIREIEVPTLLAREAVGGVRLLPIILRPCAWKTVSWLADRVVYPARAISLSSLESAEAESQLSAIVGEILKGPSADSVSIAHSNADHLLGIVSEHVQTAAEGHYYDDGWGGHTRESAEALAQEAADAALQAVREGHSGTSRIALIVECPDGRRFEAPATPVSMTVREFLRQLASADNIASSVRIPWNWTAVSLVETPDGRNNQLDPERTLYDQHLRDGDVVHIYPEMQAGCFPLDTLVNAPNGRTVLLGALQLGDQVASPRPFAEQDSLAIVQEIVREHATRLVVINDMLRITPDHGVFCVSRGGTWVPAGRLQLGDFLLRGDRRVVAVRTLTIEDSELEVGNLVLHDPADVFVASGVVVFGARRAELGMMLMKSS